MEGLIQKPSSQIDAIDSTNNNSNSNNNNNNYNNNNNKKNNNNNIIKLNNVKPPLLPKPQIIKLDSGVHRAVKSNPASPEHVAFQNVSEVSKAKSITVQNEASLSDKSVRLSQKSASMSPKPQLPPKLNVINSSKSAPSLNNLASPRKSVLENSSSSETTTPVRPPRTQLKSIKKNENNSCTAVESDSLAKTESEMNLVLSRRKSASLHRGEELNCKVKDLLNDADQLSEFCKQVEMCSRHSHLLKNESHLHSPLQKLKKKEGESELDSSGTCTNSNMVIEKNLFSSTNEIQNRSINVLSCESSINIYVNELKESENSTGENAKILSQESSNLSSNLKSPKSFLHQYVNSCNQTKESEGSIEKPIGKNENIQSFLHKNRDQFNQKLSKSQSLGEHDRVKPDNFLQISVSDSVDDKNLTADKEPLFKQDYSKKSDTLSLPDGGTSFSKRFPWFGSFGKGNKKEAGKKGRCVSQFYSSSTEVDEDILQERNRTKSLPDIKHARTVPDRERFLLKDSETSANSSFTQIGGDFQHSDSDDDKDSLNQIEFDSGKDSKEAGAYLKARELMTSEEVFIDVLKLLNVDFRNYVQARNFENPRSNSIPQSELNKILNHLSQLQSLNEDILGDLRKRIENWEINPKISDVICKKGAFLKMYTTYIQNFESQTNYLDECVSRYPKFGKIVREFESLERCKKLSLKHYMLKPVQRIPQYRLLLNDYLKRLDESSPDYADTLTALKIVCEVVDHANRNLAHGDKEGRLMHFQSILSDYVLIKPGRELIKDGPLEKICRKSVKDRYFILLNDCLLHTTYSKQYMKIHQELPLSGMKICPNEDQIYPHSFTVHSIKRSFILCAKTESDCREWVEKLREAIGEHIKRQMTFLNVKIEANDSFKLGKEAPVWVPDSKVTMCQICTAEFTALFRRHHCRGCGKVICRNCGNNQAPLQYTNFKPDRVCDQCFELLLKDFKDSEESICGTLKESLNLNDATVQSEYLSIRAKFIKYGSVSSLKKSKYIPPRLKEVRANDSESTISGWLHRKSRKSWKLFWYVLKDHVLYVYKASEDVLALETIPVLGYEVERVKINFDDLDKALMFSLVHPSQTPLVFRAESQSSADRWFNALTTASSFDYLAI